MQSKINNNNSKMLEQAEVIDATRSVNNKIKARAMKERETRMIINHILKASKKINDNKTMLIEK